MGDVDPTKKHRKRRSRHASFFDVPTRLMDPEPSMLAEGSEPGEAETDEGQLISADELAIEPPTRLRPSGVNQRSGPAARTRLIRPAPPARADSDVIALCESDLMLHGEGDVSLPAPGDLAAPSLTDGHVTRVHLPDDFEDGRPTDIRVHQDPHVPVDFRVARTEIALHCPAPRRRLQRSSPSPAQDLTELRPAVEPHGPYCPVDAPQLAAYQIVRKLDAGGMGIVYEALHRQSGQRVAIKYMRRSASEKPALVKRFLAEAVAASRIDHPGITTLYDYGHDHAGVPYLVMEYLEGESLAARLDAGRLELDEFLSISRQLAMILQAAHDSGVIHRDLKPDNVFIDRSSAGPRIKILDFGVAKFMADDLYLLQTTGTGHIIGTPFYMSPEQCGGNRKVDPRSDIYSLGCVMYQMLTGRVPFCGNLIDVVYSHRQKQAVPIPHYNPRVPHALVALIEHMMAKRPDERPASMTQVEAALSRVFLDPPAGTPAPRDSSADLMARSLWSRESLGMGRTVDSIPGGGAARSGIGPRRSATPYSPPIYGARGWLLVPVILVLLGAAGVSIWLAAAL